MNHWTFLSDNLKRLNNEHENFTNLVADEVFHIENVFKDVSRLNQAEGLDPRPQSQLWQQYKVAVTTMMSRYRQQLIDATVQCAMALEAERKLGIPITGQQAGEYIPPPPNGRGLR